MAEEDGYSGIAWGAGSMVGLRNFRLMSDGVLTGMTGTPWHSGVNEAACMTQIARGNAKPGHAVADKSCSCGFWAYLRPELANTQQYGSSLIAVVEGFGRVTYGPLGFRCSKARILALVAPDPDVDPDQRREWAREQGMPEVREETIAKIEEAPPAPVPAASNLLWWAIVWGLPIIVALALMAGLSGPPAAPMHGVNWWQLIVGLVIAVFVIRFIGAFVGEVWWRLATRQRAEEEAAAMIVQGTAAVKRRYPEIRFYDTVEQALADFPLTR